MNVPYGRLEALQYREAPFYTGDGRVGKVDVLRVHFRAPDGDYYQHDLPNGPYTLDNAALQFMAKWGYQPTTIDGTKHDAHPDQVLLPLTRSGGSFALSQSVLKDAEEALEDAEWFASEGDEGSSDGPHSGDNGGGGPDPSTGNRAGVDHDEEGGVSAKLAGEESDAGVEVVIS